MKIEKLKHELQPQFLNGQPIGSQYGAPNNSSLMNKINELIESHNEIIAHINSKSEKDSTKNYNIKLGIEGTIEYFSITTPEIILPCPFCNWHLTHMSQSAHSDIYVVCASCNSHGSPAANAEEAIHAWNKRSCTK